MKMKIILLVLIAMITLCEKGMAESKLDLCFNNIVHRNFLIEYRRGQLYGVLIFGKHGNFHDESLKMGFFSCVHFQGGS